MKKLFSVLGLLLLLAGCQAPHRIEEPLPKIIRRADTPLVLAIPGLNAIPGFDQSIQFGQIREVLARENIPAEVVEYDSAADPIGDVADLTSDESSIAFLRVLPRVTSAIAEENKIRAEGGLPPLERLDFVSYSQGSVVVWDLIRRWGEIKARAEELKNHAPEEWEKLQKDGAFTSFADTASEFFRLKNIRAQYPDLFRQSVDFKNLYLQGEGNLKEAAQRLSDHFSSSPDYPRLQEKARAERKPPELFEEVFARDPLFQYAAFKELMPLQIRVFSICGSLLGSPEANKLYSFISARPVISDWVIGKRGKQLRDTRLGSRHHLEWVKNLFTRRVAEGRKPLLAGVHFIVGVNGNKGDGLVDQPSAHLSGHGIAQIPLSELASMREIEWQYLPDFPVTGIPIIHLKKKEFLLWEKPAASEIGAKKNPVTEFLLDFEKGDEVPAGIPLNQFSVAVYLPKEIPLKNISLVTASKKVKLTGHVENPAANAGIWTGSISSAPEKGGNLTLRIKNKEENTAEIKFPVLAGKSYFLEVVPAKDE